MVKSVIIFWHFKFLREKDYHKKYKLNVFVPINTLQACETVKHFYFQPGQFRDSKIKGIVNVWVCSKHKMSPDV